MTAENPLNADIQRLEPDALVELFEVDLGRLQGDVLRFHGYAHQGRIRWQEQDYEAWPVRATGFARTGDASQPTPVLTVANVTGRISQLCRKYSDLAGAVVRRRRTLARYLGDAPHADRWAEMPVEIWCVEQKTLETADLVEFALVSALDLAGHKLPARQILTGVCQWTYRGTECGYAGSGRWTRDNQPTSNAGHDECGHRLSCCRLRFGRDEPLPFGGFPGAGTAVPEAGSR